MKAVVIGGGIAGMTIAILLKQRQWDVIVCERSSSIFVHGHAFLMSYEGLAIINEFKIHASTPLLKQRVDLFSLKRPDSAEKIKVQLFNWYCLKRVNLVSFLNSCFTKDNFKTNRSFSHFIYENGKATAAVFDNGEIEFGDVFIGADGSNSNVREALFGKTIFTSIEVNEVVGTAVSKIALEGKKVPFQKFQSNDKGLAFGFIPASDEEVVWFMQYDRKLSKVDENKDPKKLKRFCIDMLKDYPSAVKEVLDAADFNTAYIWKTRDFDLLPKFHKNNVVLIGDAAHLALPFTSAGTTNAILDAKCLAESFDHFSTVKDAFNNYYLLRSEKVKKHTEQGRLLKETFLNPQKFSEREFLLPLIPSKKRRIEMDSLNPFKIIYFTDPICSTCWIIQPILRKLKLEFGDLLDIEYRMGGLLPSWKNYNKGGIKTPLDAAKHWEEVNISQEMALAGDVWIDDPINSSYPPSIAFKSAQIQDNDKAISFLRRLKELVFLEQKNITKWEVIEEAALSSGLDTAVLKEDIASNGYNLFLLDLELAKKLNVRSFPTFFFLENDKIMETIIGERSYESFKKTIAQYILKTDTLEETHKPETLFSMFHNMTENEYSFISNTPIKETRVILNELYQQDIITKYDSKYDIVWMLKLNTSFKN